VWIAISRASCRRRSSISASFSEAALPRRIDSSDLSFALICWERGLALGGHELEPAQAGLLLVGELAAMGLTELGDLRGLLSQLLFGALERAAQEHASCAEPGCCGARRWPRRIARRSALLRRGPAAPRRGVGDLVDDRLRAERPIGSKEPR
jgi:hypothetical protein